MRIALIGYGKMGKEIEKIALNRKHTISLKITSSNANYTPEDLKDTDVAIEFSTPANAINNIKKCFAANVPIVVGTTGWYNNFKEIKTLCEEQKQALFHATNFSVGVNLFFEINKRMAQIMNNFGEYDVEIEEIHHTAKLDAPSGTAITLAEKILPNLTKKSNWVNEPAKNTQDLGIISKRIANVPGTHTTTYSSDIDEITICHTAKNRKGFATGSVLAAEWLLGKKGVYTMEDFLKIS